MTYSLTISPKMTALIDFMHNLVLEHISTEPSATRNLSNEFTAIIESSFDGIYVTDGDAKNIRLKDVDWYILNA